MRTLAAEQLEVIMAAQFPPSATCWGKATDEVRDMCRDARCMAGEPEEEAVDFRAMSSPSQWNTQGIVGLVKFYRMLTPEKQAEFCRDWSNVLG